MEERQGEPITLFRPHVYSREREREFREKESQKEEERKKSKKLDEER